ncbi:MAG: AAA family ATPase [Spirochaetales bacterium]|nr:AAA family ATPase [Spirochaetales bacterium]
MADHKTLTYEEIRFHISDDEIKNIPTPSNDIQIIGQPRAVKALEMGTEIKTMGYNIFVTGLPGTGRNTAVRKILEKFENTPFPSRDIAIVNNFKRHETPSVLYFPPGGARLFRDSLQDMIKTLQAQIFSKLESQGYKKIKTDIISSTQNHERKVLQVFEARLNLEGFTSIMDNAKEGTADSIDIAYLYKGKPMPLGQLTEMASRGAIPEKEYQDIQKKYFSLKDDLRSIFRSVLQTKNEMHRELNTLRIVTVTPEIHTEISNLKREYPDPRIKTYLDSIAEDVSENLHLFSGDASVAELLEKIRKIRYGLNILEDRSGATSAPIIFESHPTFKNLFGTIEKRKETNEDNLEDYLSIKSGAFLRASGGFLIIQAEDLFQDEKAWKYMKRTLKNGKVSILPEGNRASDNPGAIKPAEIDIDVKVILIGNENLYEILYNKDPDFHRYFKISAEFDTTFDRNDETMGQYIHFIDKLCIEQNLLPVTAGGKAEIIKFGARIAEDRYKLSTRLSDLQDLLIEADYWTRKEDQEEIGREMIIRTQRERQYLNNLPEEKINEMISVGDISIPLKGSAEGLVNALAIHDRGYMAFGTPCLISSRTSPGDTGIINIEGEVGLSGEIHDKWLMMLEGFLRHHYASNVPLSLHCTICFEQSYGEVDGDSAASAELYAILSSIARIPIRQDLAVTGSLSQTGNVQAIGGCTEKVEGFFDICSSAGLTGTQGVILPEQNVKNLILADRVLQAIKENMFHIYPVGTINDGIEILTGMRAGERGARGAYPTGTFNHAVEKNLKALHQKVKSSSE